MRSFQPLKTCFDAASSTPPALYMQLMNDDTAAAVCAGDCCPVVGVCVLAGCCCCCCSPARVARLCGLCFFDASVRVHAGGSGYTFTDGYGWAQLRVARWAGSSSEDLLAAAGSPAQLAAPKWQLGGKHSAQKPSRASSVWWSACFLGSLLCF